LEHFVSNPANKQTNELMLMKT